MKLTKEEMIKRGFKSVPFLPTMECLQKGGLKLVKREDLKVWRCYISQSWHDITTIDQVDVLLKIVNG